MGWREAIAATLHRGTAGADIAAETDARRQIEICMRDHVCPVLEAERDRLTADGVEAWTDYREGRAELDVVNFNGQPLQYAVRGVVYKQPVVNLSSLVHGDTLQEYARMRIETASGHRERTPRRCHRAAVARAVRRYYRKFLLRPNAGTDRP